MTVILLAFVAALSAPAGVAPLAREGGGAPCTYGISPASQSFPASGGPNKIGVTLSPAGCTGTWSAKSTVDWITTEGNAGGTSSGVVVYRVAVTLNTLDPQKKLDQVSTSATDANAVSYAWPGCTFSDSGSFTAEVDVGDRLVERSETGKSRTVQLTCPAGFSRPSGIR